MFRYLVFGFSHYYPGGGMSDIALKTNDIDELEEFVKKWAYEEKGNNYENLHVYDAESDKLIYKAKFNVHDYFNKNARDLIIEMNELINIE